MRRQLSAHSKEKSEYVVSRPRACSDSKCALLNYWRRRLAIGEANFEGEQPLNWMDDWSARGHFLNQAEDLYKPLAPWQTRLVQLIGRRSAEEDRMSPSTPAFELKLVKVDFADMEGVGITGTSDVVHYKAVSHVWGSVTSTCMVLCNDRPLMITSGLAMIFRHLAPDEGSLYLWVDALCINQSDTAEKEVQVRNIMRIFEKAEEVIGWIGDAPSSCALLPVGGELDVLVNARHGDYCQEALLSLKADLNLLENQELWTRTWVRQEIFAARKMRLIGANFRGQGLEFGELLSAMRFWKGFKICDDGWAERQGQREQLKGASSCLSLMALHYQHAGTDRHDYVVQRRRLRYSIHWLRILRQGAQFRVTDERDRIYGVFGMISSPATRFYVESRPDIQLTNFPIKYTKSVSEVFQDVVKFLINIDRNLDCLLVFEDRSSRANDLPTWVTDWRRLQTRSLLSKEPARLLDEQTYGVPLPQAFNDIGQLTLQGIRLFTVQELSGYDPFNFEEIVKEQQAQQTDEESVRKPKLSFGHLGGLAGDLDRELDEVSLSYFRCRFRDASLLRHMKIAYVPLTTMIGDEIAVLKGARFPFVLRPVPVGKWEFVGPAIVWDVTWPSPTSQFRYAMNKTGDGIHWDPSKLQTFKII